LRFNTWLGTSLFLAAILVQAGCGTESAATPTPAGSPAATSAARSSATEIVILPGGTLLAVRTNSALSTNSQESGQSFTANLDQPLLQNGREIAPQGADVEGKIIAVDKGGRVKGLASITVELSALHVGGQLIYVSTNSVTQNAQTTKRKDAVEIGIGAGVGAVIGALAGGGKGAAIGAGAGGAAGTGVVLATRGEPAVIPSESLLTFELRAPITVILASR